MGTKNGISSKHQAREKVDEFMAGGVKTHPCGRKRMLDFLRKTTYIKNLDGKVLYEGKGSFQSVLENAVEEGIELPRADLRNQKFQAINLNNAKLEGASFEGSKISSIVDYETSFHSSITNSDLRNVSFKNTAFDKKRFLLGGSDVEKADFDGKHLGLDSNDRSSVFSDFGRFKPCTMKNFDKAYNITKADLKEWTKAQDLMKAEREKTQEDNTIVNIKPVDVVAIKQKQGR
ncbi:MAG: pentapeptide repeat-containing protein [Alphaproteobacteria bacterium]|nr:pentapeptide repeat-containing protein [Alphaproteobacteria bacterium]